MHLYTQNAKTTHFRWLEMSGFVFVEAPAPSPGEHEMFWYAALRTAATWSKIPNYLGEP